MKHCNILFHYSNANVIFNFIIFIVQHIIRCADNSKTPIYGKTRFNVLRIRVRKTTPQSRVFEFSMKLKNDLGKHLNNKYGFNS